MEATNSPYQHQPLGHLFLWSNLLNIFFFLELEPRDELELEDDGRTIFSFCLGLHTSFQNLPRWTKLPAEHSYFEASSFNKFKKLSFSSSKKTSSLVLIVFSLVYLCSRDSFGTFLANRGEAPPQLFLPKDGCWGVLNSSKSLCLISNSLFTILVTSFYGYIIHPNDSCLMSL